MNAYSYPAYRHLIAGLVAEGRTTGPVQSKALIGYTRLNEHRMRRLDKTVRVLPALAEAVRGLPRPYEWVVLTEGWCGDAAQLVPVLEAVAQASAGRLRPHYLLRDDNPGLMDQHLTQGGRAIPKLLVLHPATLTQAGHWGPRPAPAQALLARLRAEGVGQREAAIQLHTWYAHDRTRTTQHELLALVQGLP